MSHGSLLVRTVLCLLAGFEAAWCAWRLPQLTSSDVSPNQRWCTVATGDKAVFDLPFEPGVHYTLIVGSLADSDRTVPLTLSAEVASPGSRRRPEPRSSRRGSMSLLRDSAVVDDYGGTVTVNTNTAEIAERLLFLYTAAGPQNDPDGYTPVACRVVGEGARVRVLLDVACRKNDLASGLIEEIVSLADESLLPQLAQTLGTVFDLDGDGKLTIVLTPWLSRLQGGRAAVDGLVCPDDFRTDLDRPFSNRADVLYLNAALGTGPRLKTILAHELAHVVCCSERVRRDPSRPYLEDWLAEGIAHVIETTHGDDSNIHHRVEAFLAAPQDAPLVVDDYARAGLWRDPASRGATFLFLRWCVDRFGSELLRRLIQSPHRGPECLSAVTGRPFAELFRQWTVDLAASNTDRLHTTEWNVDAAPPELVVRGTSACFVRLVGTSHGMRRITVAARPGAKLQVTLRRDAE